MIVRQGRLAGAILLGDGLGGPALLEAFNKNEALPDRRADLLFPGAAGAKTSTIADAPDAFQVCNCNGVTKGAILNAAKSGCRTLKAVCDSTRAATGCGSCKPLVQTLLESASDGLMSEDPSVHYYVPAVPFG